MLDRLLPHALRRVDQQQGRFGAGGPGDHVLEKLLVSGRVDDDVLPRVPREKRTGRVNGDALFLFFQERIEQEGVFELLSLLAADGLDLLKPAVRERAGVGIEPAEEGGLAVVHVPDEHDIQMFGRFGGGCGHIIIILVSRRLKNSGQRVLSTLVRAGRAGCGFTARVQRARRRSLPCLLPFLHVAVFA